MFVMIGAKMLENSKGKCLLKFSKPEWDWHILKKYHFLRHNVNHVSRESLANFFHKTAKFLGSFLPTLAKKLEKRFSRIGDMIRGRHMVENRGSVSFFLKNIGEHKKNL